jgi:hypothetical protein
MKLTFFCFWCGCNSIIVEIVETYSAIGAQEEGLHSHQRKVLKLCEFVIAVWYVL